MNYEFHRTIAPSHHRTIAPSHHRTIAPSLQVLCDGNSKLKPEN